MPSKLRAIIDECKRQVESCLYTSTALFEVIRVDGNWRILYLAIPIVFGGVSTIGILVKSTELWVPYVLAACTFVASIVPAILNAVRFADGLEEYRSTAAKFKNLQDSFRQLAQIHSKGTIDDVERRFSTLMEKMNDTRNKSVVVPQWAFEYAQGKIKKGDYDFDVDLPPETA